jgi:hypothetical protein
MELEHILKEMDETDRLKRQILNPLADIPALKSMSDYRITPIFDALQEASINETLRVIWENNQALEALMREAMSPLYDLQPRLQRHAVELYEAMSPMREMAAAAMKDAERIYESMQPLRDAVENIHQHAGLMNAMQPASAYLYDVYAHHLLCDTAEITRLINKSEVLAEARALAINGPKLESVVGNQRRIAINNPRCRSAHFRTKRRAETLHGCSNNSIGYRCCRHLSQEACSRRCRKDYL